MFVPAVPIIFLIAYIFMSSNITTAGDLLTATDSYLGGNIYFSSANLTAYDSLSTNIQMPIIRLGIVSENANIKGFLGGDILGATIVLAILVLGFLAYSVVARAIYEMGSDQKASALKGINGATIVLAIVTSLLMMFVSSFYLGGFKLIIIINFGMLFTFMIPYAASGRPLGESLFSGFKFATGNLGKVVSAFIGSMGAVIMIPVGLLIFTTPILANLPASQQTVANLLKLGLGLFAIMFSLFYQMALCAGIVFMDKRTEG